MKPPAASFFEKMISTLRMLKDEFVTSNEEFDTHPFFYECNFLNDPFSSIETLGGS